MGKTPNKPPLKVLLADTDTVARKLNPLFSTIPSLVQTWMTIDDDDENFGLILTCSKELAERPEIALWRGPIFVWDDMLHQTTSRDPWVLGNLVKTFLRLGKVDQSISESPVINQKTISRFMIPLLLDSKAVRCFSGDWSCPIHLTSALGKRLRGLSKVMLLTMSIRYLLLHWPSSTRSSYCLLS